MSSQIEGDFIAMLDEWHSLPETWDNDLDAQIHRWYSNPPKVWPKRPYFSPSSLGSCPRELYEKARGAKRDVTGQSPHQGRWTRFGTAVGDVIQRDLLFIEKHFEAKTGNRPPFVFERNADGTPMFEDFAKTNKAVTFAGETFYLYGAPDGIMRYVTDDGEVIRVGLECKTKQTTPARTSLYSMRAPEDPHVRQAVAYGHMFDCEYYIVLYVNAAKQSWVMTDEEYEKTPDVRAFCIRITDEMKADIFDKPADIVRRVRENDPPPLDLDGWTFNSYKTACAVSLTDEEVAELQRQVNRVLHSGMPDWKKRNYSEAMADVLRIRKTEGAADNNE